MSWAVLLAFVVISVWVTYKQRSIIPSLLTVTGLIAGSCLISRSILPLVFYLTGIGVGFCLGVEVARDGVG